MPEKGKIRKVPKGGPSIWMPPLIKALLQDENVFAVDMVVGVFRHDLLHDGDT